MAERTGEDSLGDGVNVDTEAAPATVYVRNAGSGLGLLELLRTVSSWHHPTGPDSDTILFTDSHPQVY